MAEQQEQLEMEVDTETEVEVEASEEQPNQENVEIVEEDQFDKAQSSTQKRIDRLTKKMRDAQRREEEAVNYAKQVQQESAQLKQRFSALDSNYVSEYTNRVQTQMEQTEKELARAMELGDTTAVVEANKKMIALSAENDRANQAKVAQERQQQQAQQQAQQQSIASQQQQAVPQQQIKRPDPKAQDWAARNDWFGQDEAKTFAAFGIHKKLVEDEGFDPTSDEYYTELDRRISDTFGGNAKNAGKRPAQTVAGVSRSNSGRSSGKKVRLTPSQVAIAKKLGVPLEEYAKYVKE